MRVQVTVTRSSVHAADEPVDRVLELPPDTTVDEVLRTLRPDVSVAGQATWLVRLGGSGGPALAVYAAGFGMHVSPEADRPVSSVTPPVIHFDYWQTSPPRLLLDALKRGEEPDRRVALEEGWRQTFRDRLETARRDAVRSPARVLSAAAVSAVAALGAVVDVHAGDYARIIAADGRTYLLRTDRRYWIWIDEVTDDGLDECLAWFRLPAPSAEPVLAAILGFAWRQSQGLAALVPPPVDDQGHRGLEVGVDVDRRRGTTTRSGTGANPSWPGVSHPSPGSRSSRWWRTSRPPFADVRLRGVPPIGCPLVSQTHRTDLRNVAIVAHVDHGKTTLVDAMLHQAGAFTAHQAEGVADRVMDSGDLEREKGITILAKNTAVHYRGPSAHELAGGDMTINIIDTPGHADFGGEVERGLSMVDGIVLLGRRLGGPAPPDPVRAAQGAQRRHAGDPGGQQDRPQRRPDRRGRRRDLRAVHGPARREPQPGRARLPGGVRLRQGRHRVAGEARERHPPRGHRPRAALPHHPGDHPRAEYDEGAPLQAHVTNLDASPFLGRLALLRIKQGNLKKGQQVAWMRRDGEVKNVKITELLVTEGLERKPGETAGPGDIVAVAGIPDITIGETLADPENPVALPLIHVDEPAISMTIGTNTSPLVGKGGKGHKVTARLVKDRLDAELVGNVSLRVLPTERPDAWEVQGRGELALAILVEQMRREGYELTVGKPQVVTKEVDGKVHEPYERLTIDAPEEFLGTITELLANRKGRMEGMTNHGTGWVRMEFVVPARGLIGFRTDFLTETRGTGIAHHISEGYHPWAGEIRSRASGSLVADRTGAATAYAMTSLQERGIMFVDPATEVYEGMIVGENSRADDMDVNITKEKQQTNIRSATSDNFEKLIPPRRLSLEQCLEFCREDECVEITPETVRIRKVVLDQNERGKIASRARKGT